MELARLAANDDRQWKRSALFMAFAAEEIGLLGSAHFVNNPTVPDRLDHRDDQLDMIGRITNNRVFVGGVGTSPNYRTMIEQLNAGTRPAARFLGFRLRIERPHVVQFKEDPGAVLLLRASHRLSQAVRHLRQDQRRGRGQGRIARLWHDGSRGERQRATGLCRSAAAAGARRGGGGGYGAYFGSVPDFREDIEGVLFADVVNNSPAAKAGLKAGDIMVEFDGKPIQRLNDYAFLLRSKQPGDVVAVVVKRNGETIRVNVTLETRR